MSRVFSVLAFAASVVAITPACAADMYGGSAPAPSYGYSDGSSRPAGQWEGGYVGGQIGYAWGHGGMNGAHGGVYGGANVAVGSNIVAGVEADVNISGQDHYSAPGGNLTQRTSNWNASVRGRVGVAYDKVMPYATAGIAFADDTVKALGANDTTTKVGYVVGLGVEGRLTDRVSMKGELTHMGFSGTDHVTGWTNTHNDVSSTVVRTGVGYKF
jgi:outer membrane immunogenic protein